MKFITTLGAAAILALGFTTSAQAGQVGGAQYEVENSCFIIWWFFVNTDCSYDGSRAAFVGPNQSFGPINLYAYYRPGESTGGDTKRLRIDGDMTVTGSSGAGDTIDATLTMAAGERVGPCGQGGDCTESWDSITHTISAAADRAVVNAAGGFTYEVAANVFPAKLLPCVPYSISAPFPPQPGNMLPFNCNPAPANPQGWNFANQLFPSVTASPAFPFFDATAWQAQSPDGQGVSSFEGGRGNKNVGTTSTAVQTGYACAGPECSSAAMLGSSPGYENVLLKVDTNAAGGIISAQMAYTQEYFLVVEFFGDSWDGNFVDMSGFVAVAKPGGSPDVQIDKKNPLSVTIFGAANLDVTSIDVASLQLGPGLFYTQETYGSEIHGKAHIGDKDNDGHDDLTAHFASNESDLRCGMDEVKLNGVSDGVAFTTTVTMNGIGKACN